MAAPGEQAQADNCGLSCISTSCDVIEVAAGMEAS
jgi:hypothetical protein